MKVFQKPMSDRPATETFHVVESKELDWVRDSVEGFWTKELYSDPSSGRTTMLMKIDPGAFAGDHSHDRLEQIYVLEGDFYDQNRTYAAGDFIARQPGANHRAGSVNGAVVLLFFG